MKKPPINNPYQKNHWKTWLIIMIAIVVISIVFGIVEGIKHSNEIAKQSSDAVMKAFSP